MPEINSFIIDTNDLSANKTGRQFSIKADVGSEFIVQVVNDSGAFYNWKTKAFNNGHIPQNNLRKKLTSTVYNDNIIFPASASATYNVLLIAPPDTDTTFSDAIATGGENVVNKSITQLGNVTVTFAASTANTASYGNASSPGTEEDPPAANVTSVGSPVQAGTTAVASGFIVYNRKTSANGFGLRLTRDPVDTDWYFQTTEAVSSNPAGDGEDSDVVNVASLTDLVVGMELIYHKGTTVPTNKAGSTVGTTTITLINTATKQITFSKDVAFEDSETMTFQAQGWVSIKNAIGLSLSDANISAKTLALSKTVRAGATSASIALTDTYGISGGSHVTVTGDGINTSATNNINTVTEDFDASGTDGVAVMDLSSTVTTGATLYFSGSATRIDVGWTNVIAKYPDANRTIYLNLDNFITPGAAS